MPYRKKTYRKKKRKYNKYKPTVQKSPGLSNSQIVKMRYAEILTLDAGTAGVAFNTFTASNPNDPYTGVGGHQAKSFDQWMTFYDHFTVLGSKIKVTFQNISVDNTIGNAKSVMVYVGSKPTTTQAFSGLTSMVEDGKYSYKLLTGSQGSASTRVLNGYYSPKKFFGIKDVAGEHDLRGQQGTDPVENAYWEMGCGCLDLTSDPFQIQCMVQIDYIVLLTEPKILGQS